VADFKRQLTLTLQDCDALDNAAELAFNAIESVFNERAPSTSVVDDRYADLLNAVAQLHSRLRSSGIGALTSMDPAVTKPSIKVETLIDSRSAESQEAFALRQRVKESASIVTDVLRS